MKLYNTSYIITETKDETKINLFAENEFYDKVQIAHFDFYYNEGWVMDLKGNKKDVKRHSTIVNYLFKQNENLGWDSAKVEQAKKNAKQIKLDETKSHRAELQEKDEQKALDMINGIKEWNEKYINICKATENKTDDELIKSIEFTFKNASKKTLKEVFAVIRNYDSFVKIKKKEEATEVISSIENVTTVNKDEREVFYLYGKTFDTYMDAYNYAIQNESKTTMILSSHHPTMTNEKLQQLESDFTFNFMGMSLDDKKEFFAYIESCSHSIDRDDRYYKLKTWIERGEKALANEKKEKERLYNLAKQSYEILETMKSKGLEVKESGNMVQWIFNGEKVYVWFGGVCAEKYHADTLKVYEEYFKNK